MLDARNVQVLRGPLDLLGKIPYLLEYHPSDCVLTLLLDRDGRLLVGAEMTIEAPVDVIANAARDTAIRSRAETALIIGYAELAAKGKVTAVADSLGRHINVAYSCLMSAGRVYCLKPQCGCDAGVGLPFDPKATAVAAMSTIRGEVALPSKSALLALADPDPQAQAAVMGSYAAALRLPGRRDVRELHELHDRALLDQRLSDIDAARLAILLRRQPIRDAAWRATGAEMWQRNLWLDLTRRIPGRDVATPAALAAWCAWMRGEGALARAAARRAAAVNPNHGIARIVTTALDAGISPTDAVPAWPLLPDEDVA
jgi:hypothetical protein